MMLGKQVGMLFQKPNPFPFSIWRNLEFPLRQHGERDKRRIAQLVEQSLKDLGLWSEVKDKLHTSALSPIRRPATTTPVPVPVPVPVPGAGAGAESDRIADGRALQRSRPNLHAEDRGACQGTRAQKRTIVLVTHNIAQARRVADYIALFCHDGSVGRLVEHGPAQEILERPTSEFARFYFAYE